VVESRKFCALAEKYGEMVLLFSLNKGKKRLELLSTFDRLRRMLWFMAGGYQSFTLRR